MDPRGQFENLEIMSRERAALARREAEHWLAEAKYWQAEAEEWRLLREAPAPVMAMADGPAPANRHEVE